MFTKMYRHFRGKDYLLIGLDHTKKKVIYQANYTDFLYGKNAFWYRDREEFFGKHKSGVKRFTPLDDIEIPDLSYKVQVGITLDEEPFKSFKIIDTIHDSSNGVETFFYRMGADDSLRIADLGLYRKFKEFLDLESILK